MIDIGKLRRFLALPLLLVAASALPSRGDFGAELQSPIEFTIYAKTNFEASYCSTQFRGIGDGKTLSDPPEPRTRVYVKNAPAPVLQSYVLGTLSYEAHQTCNWTWFDTGDSCGDFGYLDNYNTYGSDTARAHCAYTSNPSGIGQALGHSESFAQNVVMTIEAWEDDYEQFNGCGDAIHYNTCASGNDDDCRAVFNLPPFNFRALTIADAPNPRPLELRKQELNSNKYVMNAGDGLGGEDQEDEATACTAPYGGGTRYDVELSVGWRYLPNDASLPRPIDYCSVKAEDLAGGIIHTRSVELKQGDSYQFWTDVPDVEMVFFKPDGRTRAQQIRQPNGRYVVTADPSANFDDTGFYFVSAFRRVPCAERCGVTQYPAYISYDQFPGVMDGNQPGCCTSQPGGRLVDPYGNSTVSPYPWSNIVGLQYYDTLFFQRLPPDRGTVTIATASSPPCPGSSLSFRVFSIAYISQPSYQWQKNGSDIAGATSSTYSSADLQQGDVITLKVTSGTYDECQNSQVAPVISNPVTATFSPPEIAIFHDIHNDNPICAGSKVNFWSAVQNVGSTPPTYYWRKNGFNIPGANGPTFSSSDLADGDVIDCAIDTHGFCSGGAFSNRFTMHINPATYGLTTQVYDSSFCAGSGYEVFYTFTANETNCLPSEHTFTAQLSDATGSFASPVAIGSVTGSGLPLGPPGPSQVMPRIYARIPANTPPGSGYRVRVVSDAPALTSNNNGSNIQVVVGPQIGVQLTMDTSQPGLDPLPDGTVCKDTDARFTCNVTNGGEIVTYQWLKNGVPITGESSSNTTSFGRTVTRPEDDLVTGDVITCKVVSQSPGGCGGGTVVAEGIRVTELPPMAFPTIGLERSPSGKICRGEPILFTAVNPTDAGLAPFYRWTQYDSHFLPGNVGTNNSAYSTSLTESATVSVLMTSSHPCNYNNGAAAIAAQTVEVSPDTTKPTISGMPSNRSLSTTAASCTRTASWIAPTVSDDCRVATFISDHHSGEVFPLGTTPVTYTATDVEGNVQTATFNVTVFDGANPVISGMPANLVLNSGPASCSQTATWTTQPSATDNCGTPSLSSNYHSGDTFPVGVTPVTYTAVDSSGRTATASFTVTVKDVTKSVINSMPANITLASDDANPATCSQTATWSEPSASDNCTVASLGADHHSGDVFPLGTTPVTYTAADPSGNVETRSFTVNVSDTTKPLIHGMPANIVLNSSTANPASCAQVATWVEPTMSDNCGGGSLTSSHHSGDSFPLGSTTVTYTATDAYGNFETASFTVTVYDDTQPTISGTPADLNLDNSETSADSRIQVASWTAPTVSDNCSVSSLTSDYHSGDAFPLGTTTVTYTAADPSGNLQIASFDVTVRDTTCAAQIEATQAMVDAACPCAARGLTHRRYVQCADGQMARASSEGILSRRCRFAARAAYVRSTCGREADEDWTPCVRKFGKRVSCSIKKAARCTAPGMTACPNSTSCLDAADTSADGKVDDADSGQCAP